MLLLSYRAIAVTSPNLREYSTLCKGVILLNLKEAFCSPIARNTREYHAHVFSYKVYQARPENA